MGPWTPANCSQVACRHRIVCAYYRRVVGLCARASDASVRVRCKDDSGMVRGLEGRADERRRVRPSSTASRDAAASSVPSVVSQPPLGTATRRIRNQMTGEIGLDEQSVSIQTCAQASGTWTSLTNPIVGPFPTCDYEHLPCCLRDGDRNADGAGYSAILAHRARCCTLQSFRQEYRVE